MADYVTEEATKTFKVDSEEVKAWLNRSGVKVFVEMLIPEDVVPVQVTKREARRIIDALDCEPHGIACVFSNDDIEFHLLWR